MAASTFGPKNEPQFADGDAPDVAVNPTQAAAYAAKVGNTRVDTSANRTAASGKDVWLGLRWFDTTTNAVFEYISGWVRRQVMYLGRDRRTSQLLLVGAGTPTAWMDVCTVTATSTGGECSVAWRAIYANGGSGANRSVDFQVVCDGNLIEQIQSYDSPLTPGAIGYGASDDVASTPGAGSHTWKLQARASASSACYVKSAAIKVTEV